MPNPRIEQYTVRVADEDRISGRLYDYDSGICMGLASDRDKKDIPPNVPFKRMIAGCPHKLVIHP